MTTTGWSPLPFALRLASINRKKQQELADQQELEIDQYRQHHANQNMIQPETPILPDIDSKARRQTRSKRPRLPPPPPPPESGLHAYTQNLWPPKRRKRKRKRRSTKHHSPTKTTTATPKTSATPQRTSDFLWLPYFRRLKSNQFTEEGRNPIAAQNLYDTYVSLHRFAFNNCGIYYVQGLHPRLTYYGIALDLDQARHRLIDIMRKNKAPDRLQEIFNGTSDERQIRFHVVERLSPFYKKTIDTGVGQTITIRTARNFTEYRAMLYDKLKTTILNVNLDRVKRSIMYPIVWNIWKAHVKTENAERFRAACRLQRMWRIRQGGLAAELKRQHKKQLEKEHAAACKIQSLWRIRQGGLVAELKRQHKLQLEREDKAIRKLQLWWSQMTGGFAAKMKARAQMHLMQEEEREDKAIRRLQMWWSQMTGGFAAKMKARAQMHLMQEEEEMNRAALKIQVAWRRRSGQLAKHMKRQAQKYADAQTALELSVVLKLQVMYRRKHGKLAYHMASMQRREARREKKRREIAAIYIQYRWRVSKGMLAQHLIRRARKLVKRRRIKRKTEVLLYEHTETKASVWSDLLWNEMQDPVVEEAGHAESVWEKCWDTGYQCEYWFNRETQESTWELPYGEGSQQLQLGY